MESTWHVFSLSTSPAARGQQVGDSAMTTLQSIDLTCPVCETRFRSQAVVSTNSFGGKRTDFHERAAGTQPLPYLVHMCSRCGYAGSEKDFTEEAEITPTLREHVWNELAPKLHQSVLWHQQHGAPGASSAGASSTQAQVQGSGSALVQDPQ